MKTQEHPLSWESLTRIVIVGLIVFLAWQALGILADITIAVVLAASIYPIVKTVQVKFKMPLLLSIFFVLAVPILLLFFLLGFSIIPTIAAQIPGLLTTLNASIGHLTFFHYSLSDFNFMQFFQSHLDYVAATESVTLSIFSFVTTLFLVFYLIYDAEKLSTLVLDIFPYREKGELKELSLEVSNVVGKYIRGNVYISIICGLIIYLGLVILKIPYALPLSIFIAVLDLLPLVGLTIGIIPAVLIGFGISPLKGLLVIVVFIVYAQIENAILSPVIYNKALHLYPSVVFLSVIIGATLFGVLGAFLALPVAASIPPIVEYKKNYKKRHSTA